MTTSHKSLFLRLTSLALACLSIFAASCITIDGDNSDFDFNAGGKVASPDRVPDSFRILSYNVRRCVPTTSPTPNYDNIARALKYIDADVIALQELDSCTTRSKEYQLEELARRTGYMPTYGAILKAMGGSYGIGILSRTNPTFTDIQPLPGVEPRAFLVTEFDKYVYICTHLCANRADNREWSFDLINDYVTKRYGSSNKPVFLAGDLNSTSLPASAPAKWEVISSAMATFPSKSQRIDFVLRFKGNSAPCKVIQAMVPSYPDLSLQTYSDHLPTFVDVEKF